MNSNGRKRKFEKFSNSKDQSRNDSVLEELRTILPSLSLSLRANLLPVELARSGVSPPNLYLLFPKILNRIGSVSQFLPERLPNLRIVMPRISTYNQQSGRNDMQVDSHQDRLTQKRGVENAFLAVSELSKSLTSAADMANQTLLRISLPRTLAINFVQVGEELSSFKGRPLDRKAKSKFGETGFTSGDNNIFQSGERMHHNSQEETGITSPSQSEIVKNGSPNQVLAPDFIYRVPRLLPLLNRYLLSIPYRGEQRPTASSKYSAKSSPPSETDYFIFGGESSRPKRIFLPLHRFLVQERLSPTVNPNDPVEEKYHKASVSRMRGNQPKEELKEIRQEISFRNYNRPGKRTTEDPFDDYRVSYAGGSSNSIPLLHKSATLVFKVAGGIASSMAALFNPSPWTINTSSPRTVRESVLRYAISTPSKELRSSEVSAKSDTEVIAINGGSKFSNLDILPEKLTRQKHSEANKITSAAGKSNFVSTEPTESKKIANHKDLNEGSILTLPHSNAIQLDVKSNLSPFQHTAALVSALFSSHFDSITALASISKSLKISINPGRPKFGFKNLAARISDAPLSAITTQENLLGGQMSSQSPVPLEPHVQSNIDSTLQSNKETTLPHSHGYPSLTMPASNPIQPTADILSQVIELSSTLTSELSSHMISTSLPKYNPTKQRQKLVKSAARADSDSQAKIERVDSDPILTLRRTYSRFMFPRASQLQPINSGGELRNFDKTNTQSLLLLPTKGRLLQTSSTSKSKSESISMKPVSQLSLMLEDYAVQRIGTSTSSVASTLLRQNISQSILSPPISTSSRTRRPIGYSAGNANGQIQKTFDSTTWQNQTGGVITSNISGHRKGEGFDGSSSPNGNENLYQENKIGDSDFTAQRELRRKIEQILQDELRRYGLD